MNLIFGEIVDLEMEEGMQIGRVRVSKALRRIALELIPDAQPGDKVLLCDGVAIAKVEKQEPTNVSSYPR